MAFMLHLGTFWTTREGKNVESIALFSSWLLSNKKKGCWMHSFAFSCVHCANKVLFLIRLKFTLYLTKVSLFRLPDNEAQRNRRTGKSYLQRLLQLTNAWNNFQDGNLASESVCCCWSTNYFRFQKALCLPWQYRPPCLSVHSTSLQGLLFQWRSGRICCFNRNTKRRGHRHNNIKPSQVVKPF